MLAQMTRWNPWQELEGISRELDRVLGRTAATDTSADKDENVRMLSLRADVLERPESYLLRFDLPGVDKKDIEVEVGKNVLTVKAERRFEDASEGENYQRVERFFGRYARSFALPEDADPEKIEASCRDGVLTVEVGRKKEARPRTVKIG